MVNKRVSSKKPTAKSSKSKAAMNAKAKSSKAKSSKAKSSKAKSSKAKASKAKAPIGPVATATERDALAESIRDYASGNYPVAEVRHATCTCGTDRFEVQADDTEGCALRRCVACATEHLICDSEEYWDDSDAEQCFCTCEKSIFQVAVGFALVKDKTDVRWLYVGMRCVACALAGVYADWKIDYGPSLHLMDQA